MLDTLIQFSCALLIALILSLFFTWVMTWLGQRIGMVDMPGERRIHRKPVPRAGGVAIFPAFHITCAVVYFFWDHTVPTGLNQSWWLAFLAGSGLLWIVGIWDDMHEMAPKTKLLGQIGASAILVLVSGQHIEQIFGLELHPILGIALAVLWCVAIINAFNLIDGLDGLCSGVGIISAIGIGAAYLLRGNAIDAVILAGFLGALLGFLRYNFHPAKIFLGDSGSMFVGFTLAAVALNSAGKATVLVSMGIPLLAAGLPLMDTLLAVWRRSARRMSADLDGSPNRPKIMGADREHLHHRLLDLGLSQRKVALLLYTASLLLVSIGLISIFMTTALVGVFLLCLVIAVYWLVRHVVTVEAWETGRLIVRRMKKSSSSLVAYLFYYTGDIIWLGVAVVAAYFVMGGRVEGGWYGWLTVYTIWSLPVIFALTLFNTYRKVWSRSNFRDFLILMAAFGVGVVLSFSIAGAVWGYNVATLRLAIVFWMIAQLGVFTLRAFQQIFREWMIMAAIEGRTGTRYATRRILLYGAGSCGGLYLRELRLVPPDDIATRKLIGFLDDDKNLMHRYVHGLKVLGGLNDLEQLIEDLGIDEVIITADLRPDHERLILEKAKAMNIRLSRWRPVHEVTASPFGEVPDLKPAGREETLFHEMPQDEQEQEPAVRSAQGS
ncbi:MAG: hypothetical protein ACOCVG_02025 [Verrucomicrobiota bacterium]